MRNLTAVALLALLVGACDSQGAAPPSSSPSAAGAGTPAGVTAVSAPEQPASAPAALRPECLGYDSTVTLAGTLRRETHPGPPGYEDIANGDQPETGFYLHVVAPLCTNEDRAVPDGEAEDSVRRVQLVLDSAGYSRLRPLVGRRISLSGTLFSAFTGHHHAPLLLRDVVQAP